MLESQSNKDDLPKWTHSFSNVKPFHLLESLFWDGEQFYLRDADIKHLRGDILIPVILPAERQAFLIHFNTETLTATIYVPLQYDTP